MIILLKFDHHDCPIYVPDGYIISKMTLQNDFFDWLYEQPEHIINVDNHYVISYNEDEFLKYLNEIVLLDSREKAYRLPRVDNKKGCMILTF